MEKVLITFPSIHNGIIKSKDNPSDPNNFVSVVNGYALVSTPYSVISVDLMDYFINYITIDEIQKPAFLKLIEWMEGKHFTSEFWGYLTSWNDVFVIDDTSICVSGDKFEKILHYTEEEEIDVKSLLNLIVLNSKSGKYQLGSIGISNVTLKIIDKTIGKLIQKNSLIFEFISLNSTIRFTVDNMPCIFGIILSSNAVTSKQFLFDGFKQFCLKAELKLIS